MTTKSDPIAESTGSAAGGTLLEVEHLAVIIRGVHVVSDVSLTVGAGEVVGLVGESGSGKTLTGLSVLGLLPPTAKATGRVNFEGVEMLNASKGQLRSLRGGEVSMIFQEPLSSLNPALTVGRQIVHVIRAHEHVSAHRALAFTERVRPCSRISPRDSRSSSVRISE